MTRTTKRRSSPSPASRSTQIKSSSIKAGRGRESGRRRPPWKPHKEFPRRIEKMPRTARRLLIRRRDMRQTLQKVTQSQLPQHQLPQHRIPGLLDPLPHHRIPGLPQMHQVRDEGQVQEVTTRWTAPTAAGGISQLEVDRCRRLHRFPGRRRFLKPPTGPQVSSSRNRFPGMAGGMLGLRIRMSGLAKRHPQAPFNPKP